MKRVRPVFATTGMDGLTQSFKQPALETSQLITPLGSNKLLPRELTLALGAQSRAASTWL